MIEVTRISGVPVVINADLIEAIEAIPDTSLVLSNGRRYVVKEKPEEVVGKVAAWKQRCYRQPLTGEEASAHKKLAERAAEET